MDRLSNFLISVFLVDQYKPLWSWVLITFKNKNQSFTIWCVAVFRMRQSKNSSIHVILALLVLLQPIFGADFSVSYNGSVYLHHPQNYTYDLIGDHTSIAVRVNISVVNATEDFPLIAIFKQQADILSFRLPLTLNNRFSYDFVSRTLCPSTIILDHPGNETEQITVELSSSMTDPKKAPFYYLTLDVVHNNVELSLRNLLTCILLKRVCIVLQDIRKCCTFIPRGFFYR